MAWMFVGSPSAIGGADWPWAMRGASAVARRELVRPRSRLEVVKWHAPRESARQATLWAA
jgi:hypothetical protein